MRHLAALLLILATACTAGEATTPIPRPGSDDPPPAKDPETCLRACRVAMDVCTIATIEDKQLLADCSQQCDFTDDELACYAGAICGSDPDCPA